LQCYKKNSKDGGKYFQFSCQNKQDCNNFLSNLKKVHFFVLINSRKSEKKNVNQASFIQTHITQCYLKSYICLNIIVNDSFFWKTPERPPALGPAHLAPLTVCWDGFYLDISWDTKCNIKLVVLKFRYFEKGTKIWKNIPPCFDVTK